MSNDNDYPHEQPLPGNVVNLDIVTLNDVDPVHILRMAHDAGLTEIVITGMTKEGREFFASSQSDAADTIYHLQRAQHRVNRIIDQTSEAEDNLGRQP